MSYRILLINPDPSNAEQARLPLAEAGYEVVIAADGNSGLETFLSMQPDLVVIEATLPDRPGLEVCADIKGTLQGKKTPVIVLGKSDAEAEERERSGCDLLSEKPIEGQELLESCRRLLPNFGKEPGETRPDDALLSEQDLDQAIDSLDALIVPEEQAEADSADTLEESIDQSISQLTERPAEETLQQTISELDHAGEVLSVDEALRIPDDPSTPAAAEPEQATTPPESPQVAGTEGADIEAHLDSLFAGDEVVVAPPAPDAEQTATPDLIGIDSEHISLSDDTESEKAAETPVAAEAVEELVTEVDATQDMDTFTMAPPPQTATSSSYKWWLVAAAGLIIAVTAGVYFTQQGPETASETLVATNSQTPERAAPADRIEHTAETVQEATPRQIEPEPVEVASVQPDPVVPTPTKTAPIEPKQTVRKNTPQTAEPVKAAPAPPAEQAAQERIEEVVQPEPIVITAQPAPAVEKTTTEPLMAEADTESVIDSPRAVIELPQPQPTSETVQADTEIAPPVTPEIATIETSAPPAEMAQPAPAPVVKDPLVAAKVTEAQPVDVAVEPSPTATETEAPETGQITAELDSERFVVITDPRPRPYTPLSRETQPSPNFPSSAIKRSADEEIVLNVLVDEQGRVVRILVAQGTPGSKLVTASIDAVLRTKYVPATEDGEPIRSWTTERFPVTE